MGRKKITPEEEFDRYCRDLKNDYVRYFHIIGYSSFDPNWADGININLKVNHITRDKQNLLRLFKCHGFELPRLYYWPTPKKVSFDYMATKQVKVKGRKIEIPIRPNPEEDRRN